MSYDGAEKSSPESQMSWTMYLLAHLQGCLVSIQKKITFLLIGAWPDIRETFFTCIFFACISEHRACLIKFSAAIIFTIPNYRELKLLLYLLLWPSNAKCWAIQTLYQTVVTHQRNHEILKNSTVSLFLNKCG